MVIDFFYAVNPAVKPTFGRLGKIPRFNSVKFYLMSADANSLPLV
jgi:hypothetical protein